MSSQCPLSPSIRPQNKLPNRPCRYIISIPLRRPCMPGVSTFYTAAFINQPASPFSYLPISLAIITANHAPRSPKWETLFPRASSAGTLSAPHLNQDSHMVSTTLHSTGIWRVRLLFHSINFRQRVTTRVDQIIVNSRHHFLSNVVIFDRTFDSTGDVLACYSLKPPFYAAGPLPKRTESQPKSRAVRPSNRAANDNLSTVDKRC